MSTIEYRTGNLLDVQEGLVIHGCNAHGYMGAGVALAIKNKYPEAYYAYVRAVDTIPFEDRIGFTEVYDVNDYLFIANCITQVNTGSTKRQVDYAAVHICFRELHYFYEEGVEFHFPKIGAGLGGGDWSIISELIEGACSINTTAKNRKLVCWEL